MTEGKILGFDATTNIGSIYGDNGQRYAFSKEDWKEISLPAKDQKVDFAVNEKKIKQLKFILFETTV